MKKPSTSTALCCPICGEPFTDDCRDVWSIEAEVGTLSASHRNCALKNAGEVQLFPAVLCGSCFHFDKSGVKSKCQNSDKPMPHNNKCAGYVKLEIGVRRVPAEAVRGRRR